QIVHIKASQFCHKLDHFYTQTEPESRESDEEKVSCVFTDQRKDHTKWHKSYNISQKISCYSHNAQLLSICPESSDFLEEHQVVVIFSFCEIQASKPVRKKKKINQRKNIQHKQNCP